MLVLSLGPSGAEVLAVVTRSLPDCYLDMPKKTQESCVAYRFELATKMSHLYKKLFIETRVVADDIFTKEKGYQYYDFDIGTIESATSSASLRFLPSTPRSGTVQSSERDSTMRSSTTDSILT